MTRKKLVSKESVEKLNDDQHVVLEIIEDSSSDEGEPAIQEAETQPKVNIKAEPKTTAKKKRVLSEEQKQKMKAGRERKKALLNKTKEAPAPPPTPAPVPVQAPAKGTTEEMDMPRWFKAYLDSKATQEPQTDVKIVPPVKKSKRGRPVGSKNTKPRKVKNVVQEVAVPDHVPPPKPAMRFI